MSARLAAHTTAPRAVVSTRAQRFPHPLREVRRKPILAACLVASGTGWPSLDSAQRPITPDVGGSGFLLGGG